MPPRCAPAFNCPLNPLHEDFKRRRAEVWCRLPIAEEMDRTMDQFLYFFLQAATQLIFSNVSPSCKVERMRIVWCRAELGP